jgi:predicted PurR-regulated permease PerM/phosphoglycolate phosphatase-like HAD superfamily hydrolase
MGSRRWNNLTKILVAATLAVLAILLLYTFRAMIAPTVVAFLLAFILSFPVDWIQRSTGWPRTAAVTAIYVVLIALISITPVILLPRTADLLQSLQATIEELVVSLQTFSPGPLLQFGTYELSVNNLFQGAGDLLSNVLLVGTGSPFAIARGVTTGVLSIVYVLVLNFWLLKDSYKLQRLVLEQIPTDYQEDARRLGSQLSGIWHAFLRGQLALALTVGLMVWILLSIVGVPNAPGLAFLAGIMEFVPSIGPAISGTIGTAVALFQGSTWMPVGNIAFAIIVSTIYTIIGQIESIYLIPRLVGRQVRLHPAVTFVGIISGTIVFGLLGVLLATPIIASARTILSYIYRKLLDLEPFEPEISLQASVRIPGLIAGRKIDAIIFDLDGTLAPINWRARTWAATHLQWLDQIISPDTRSRLVHHAMVNLEGLCNFIQSQLLRLKEGNFRNRIMPVLDLLRGYPPVDQLQPLPGLEPTLSNLATRYRLVIISTRTQQEIDCFLATAQLPPDTFYLTVGNDSVRNLLPQEEPLQLAATQLLLEPNQILVVSDTDVYLRSARALQMATAAVLCGLGQAQDVTEADLVLDHITDLADWL